MFIAPESEGRRPSRDPPASGGATATASENRSAIAPGSGRTAEAEGVQDPRDVAVAVKLTEQEHGVAFLPAQADE